jgi:hypothetical protein
VVVARTSESEAGMMARARMMEVEAEVEAGVEAEAGEVERVVIGW